MQQTIKNHPTTTTHPPFGHRQRIKYDFVIHVFFAHDIALQFFRQNNHFSGLILSLSVFAIGYFCRSLDALIFGHISDRYGRHHSFLSTIIFMTIPILIITLLLTYHQLGILAAALFTLMRIIQGLAIGGELGCAITFIAESVAQQSRAFTVACVVACINLGILLATAVAYLIKHNHFIPSHAP